MKVSLTGLLWNAGGDIMRTRSRPNREAVRGGLVLLHVKLEELKASRDIAAFFKWYLEALPVQAALIALPKRPGPFVSQPGLTRYSLVELHTNLIEVLQRGDSALEDFFNCYIIERSLA